MKLELERVSTPRPGEALVLHSLNVALPRPRVHLDRLDLILPEETPLEPVDNCRQKLASFGPNSLITRIRRQS
jgi:hypothetical protein